MVSSPNRAFLVAILTFIAFGMFGSSVMAAPNVVDQYTEQVPTVTGDLSSSDAEVDATGNGQESGSTEIEALAAPSQDDAAGGGGPVSGNASGNPSQTHQKSTSEETTGRTSADSDGPGLPSALAAGVGTSETDGGLGSLFPILLLVSLVVALGFAFFRWRGTGRDLTG